MQNIDIEATEQQAIDAAINLQWETAISLNNKIIGEDKKNIGAYLRLGFAYLQIKNIAEAKKYYQKALKVQPKNHVALENIERIKAIEGRASSHFKKERTQLNPTLFLEMPGRTKTISLVNLGQKKDIATISVGQEVYLRSKSRKVEVRTRSGVYLGCFPDDLSRRLLFFLKAKSEYTAFIQESSVTRVVVFLKEESKGSRVKHLTSFPSNIQSSLEDITDIDTENLHTDSDEDSEEEEEEDDETDEIQSLAEKLPEKVDESLLGIRQESEEDDQEE